MKNIFNLAEFCRVCVRLERQLTSTEISDADNVKVRDKLSFCIGEIVSAKKTSRIKEMLLI